MIEITKLEESDWKRYKAIRLRSLKEDPDAFGTTVEQASLWDDENWNNQVEKIPTFIASDEGKDVGIVRVVLESGNSQEASLISMWVDSASRGKKIGSRLIDVVLDWSKEFKVKKLRLDVCDINKSAIALYEKKGFIANGKADAFDPPRSHITKHERELVLRY